MHTEKHAPLSALVVQETGVPIYIQIREQMLGLIGAGTLRPGDQMPTMRQVAVALKVDLNTVRHAYDDLEQAGAITLVRGRGSFVAERPPPADGEQRAARSRDLAQQTIAAARAKGIDPVEVARHVIQLVEGGEAS
jgi:GntR family transcriptional regulator